MDLNDITKYGQLILEYKPLWVTLIVISATQLGKIWLQGNVDDVNHRLITRGISAATGAIAGDLLLTEIAGGRVAGAMFGLALSVVISIAYVPAIKWLRNGKEGGWKHLLADWMSGN